MPARSIVRVVEREARVYAAMWRGFAFSTFVAPILMLAALGVGLGDLVDQNSGTVDGLSYLDFVAPGLLIAGAAQIASAESLWPVLGGMKWMRFYHGMMASPMKPGHIFAGHVLWNAIRSMISAAAFLIVAALMGAIPSAWGVLAIPVAALLGAAVAAPMSAFSGAQESDVPFPIVFRLIVMPLYLFSGAFFPISQLPNWLEKVALISPLYHGVELARAATTGDFDINILANVAVLAIYIAVGSVIGVRVWSAEARAVITLRLMKLVERNVLAYRRSWLLFLSGFAEPVLFLLSIGIGVGELVGDIGGVSYKAFVAPGMLAVAAMNGAVIDTTFSFFIKYKYAHLYDGVIATPLDAGDIAYGELVWALIRGLIYAIGFVVTMLFFGLVESWWAILAAPAALLITYAFAGAGLGATTYMRSFMDFDMINMAIVPLFLFSGTFFPISQYPDAIQVVVRLTPLYQGVAIERGLILGDLSWTMLLNAAYLIVMGTIGVRLAARRVGVLLKP